MSKLSMIMMIVFFIIDDVKTMIRMIVLFIINQNLYFSDINIIMFFFKYLSNKLTNLLTLYINQYK